MKIKAQFHTLCGWVRDMEIDVRREFVFCWSDRGIAYFTEGRSRV